MNVHVTKCLYIAIIAMVATTMLAAPPLYEDREEVHMQYQKEIERVLNLPENRLISELRGLRIAAERIATALEVQNKTE